MWLYLRNTHTPETQHTLKENACTTDTLHTTSPSTQQRHEGAGRPLRSSGSRMPTGRSRPWGWSWEHSGWESNNLCSAILLLQGVLQLHSPLPPQSVVYCIYLVLFKRNHLWFFPTACGLWRCVYGVLLYSGMGIVISQIWGLVFFCTFCIAVYFLVSVHNSAVTGGRLFAAVLLCLHRANKQG